MLKPLLGVAIISIGYLENQTSFFHRRINALFILLDAMTAVVLGKLAKILAKNLLKDQAANVKVYHQVCQKPWPDSYKAGLYQFQGLL